MATVSILQHRVMQPEIQWRLLVALSFIPLAVKAVRYATIGGYVPLLVLCFFGALVAWGSLYSGSKAETRAVKIWSVAIILWGVTRVGLMILHRLFEIPETHIAGQFTGWYVFVSLGHIVLGGYLFRQSRNRP